MPASSSIDCTHHFNSGGPLEWQAEARAEGLAEGRAEGRAKGGADVILGILAKRFPPAAPADLAAGIRTTRDVAKLIQWAIEAATTPSIEEFRRTVQLGNL